MESIQARFQNMRELVARELGSRAAYNSPLFSSVHNAAGESSRVARLPGIATDPIQDFITGEFFFMADYDRINQNDKPIQ